MITSKKKLNEYLYADKNSLGRVGKTVRFTDEVWRYEIALRKSEYYQNCKTGIVRKIGGGYWRFIKHYLGLKCGFTIPNNVVGPGLCLSHVGTVIISPYASIGSNCKIHAGVNIGSDARNSTHAPKIGNNVYIAPGAKLFGDIVIADNVAIGANAVVNKSFMNPSVSIAGVPAKVINCKGVQSIISV